MSRRRHISRPTASKSHALICFLKLCERRHLIDRHAIIRYVCEVLNGKVECVERVGSGMPWEPAGPQPFNPVSSQCATDRTTNTSMRAYLRRLRGVRSQHQFGVTAHGYLWSSPDCH